jgi:hypothetical protein
MGSDFHLSSFWAKYPSKVAETLYFSRVLLLYTIIYNLSIVAIDFFLQICYIYTRLQYIYHHQSFFHEEIKHMIRITGRELPAVYLPLVGLVCKKPEISGPGKDAFKAPKPASVAKPAVVQAKQVVKPTIVKPTAPAKKVTVNPLAIARTQRFDRDGDLIIPIGSREYAPFPKRNTSAFGQGSRRLHLNRRIGVGKRVPTEVWSGNYKDGWAKHLGMRCAEQIQKSCQKRDPRKPAYKDVPRGEQSVHTGPSNFRVKHTRDLNGDLVNT